MKANIHSVETFGTVDGPGVRYVLFLKGCPLRCQYCHNPDTWDPFTTDRRSVDTIVEDIMKYEVFIKDGGVTASGGEPLMQMDFLIELFTKLKEKNIHTAIDTSGILFSERKREKFDQLMAVTDLVLLDIKQIDNEKHKKLTGLPNTKPKEFAAYLNEINKPVWIRHVLVPGLTTDEEDLKGLRQFLDQFTNIEKIELLPYHTLGVNKYEEMNMEYPLEGVKPPTRDQISRANEILGIEA